MCASKYMFFLVSNPTMTLKKLRNSSIPSANLNSDDNLLPTYPVPCVIRSGCVSVIKIWPSSCTQTRSSRFRIRDLIQLLKTSSSSRSGENPLSCFSVSYSASFNANKQALPLPLRSHGLERQIGECETDIVPVDAHAGSLQVQIAFQSLPQQFAAKLPYSNWLSYPSETGSSTPAINV